MSTHVCEKCFEKHGPTCLFSLPKSSFGGHKLGVKFGRFSHGLGQLYHSRRQLIPILDKPAFSQFYAPQTKILDGGTNRCVCVLKGYETLKIAYRETRSGVANWKVCPAFQHLRFGSIKMTWIIEACLFVVCRTVTRTQNKMISCRISMWRAKNA